MVRTTCGVIVMREKAIISFLILLNSDSRNTYDIPKGRMDSGEDEKTCALRELFEEAGIRPEDIDLDMGFRHYVYDKNKQKKLVIFLGWLRQKVAIKLSKEHTDYKWIDWNPPHSIQQQTIDPLLSYLEDYFL